MFALAVIGGLVHVVILLLKSTGVMNKVRGTQVVRTAIEATELAVISQKLDTIAGNHLHNLPDMEKSLDRIESKQDKIVDLLTQINTKLK